MEEEKSSSTASGVASLRALHQLFDAEPKILDDPVVLKIVDEKLVGFIRDRIADYQTPFMRGLRAHIVVRNRYAEDCLEAAVTRGVRQYVMLGAGLDTFAHRQPEWARCLNIIEVDHPATQKAKCELLTKAVLAAPANLNYRAVDLEKVSLHDSLQECTFDFGRPAFFSWLGVMVYLTEEAIDKVFSFIASLPRGSEIAFDFSPPESALEGGADGRSMIAAAAAASGEPWRTRITPESLAEKLCRLGFSAVNFLTLEEARARYFSGRKDDLPAPRLIRIGSAVV
ncbi:MAG: class I SAM-dependent methyltransferase [Smithellaceae bacterium]|nr:class I SAM-dependent methyltransferase [Smithellaceae bacterium]